MIYSSFGISRTVQGNDVAVGVHLSWMPSLNSGQSLDGSFYWNKALSPQMISISDEES
jgi:hypothetical protein